MKQRNKFCKLSISVTICWHNSDLTHGKLRLNAMLYKSVNPHNFWALLTKLSVAIQLSSARIPQRNTDDADPLHLQEYR